MQRSYEIPPVMAAYAADCQPEQVEALGAAGGFSGALVWRLTAPRGRLCLRRFPPEHPDKSRLRWIQSVVLHVVRSGFSLLPAPVATRAGEGLVEHEGHLWELTPWLSGVADYWQNPRRAKLVAAMTALGRFHQAAETFPPSDELGLGRSGSAKSAAVSPGVSERLGFVSGLLEGGFRELQAATARNGEVMPELAELAASVFPLVEPQLPSLQRELADASRIEAPLQPCLRDIWHDHVLFEGDRVSGIVDVGSMRVETIAADVARLLGSLCGNDRDAWACGLGAYQAVQPLSSGEIKVVGSLDRSQKLLSGLKWIEWVFADRRTFADPRAVLRRMEHILKGLRETDLSLGDPADDEH